MVPAEVSVQSSNVNFTAARRDGVVVSAEVSVQSDNANFTAARRDGVVVPAEVSLQSNNVNFTAARRDGTVVPADKDLVHNTTYTMLLFGQFHAQGSTAFCLCGNVCVDSSSHTVPGSKELLGITWYHLVIFSANAVFIRLGTCPVPRQRRATSASWNKMTKCQWTSSWCVFAASWGR